jgi:hypothetical protein
MEHKRTEMEVTKLQVHTAFNYEKSSDYPLSPLSSPYSPTVPKRNMSLGYVAPTAQFSLSASSSPPTSPLSPTVPKRNMSFAYVAPTDQYPPSPSSSPPSSPPSPTIPKRNMSFRYVAPSAPQSMSLTIDTSNLDAEFSHSPDSTVYSFPSIPLRKESCVPSVNDLLDSNQSDTKIPLASMRSTNFIPLNRKDSISSDASTIRDSCSSFEKYKRSPAELPTDTPESPYRQYITPEIPIIQTPPTFVIPSREHIPYQPQLRSSSLIVLTNMQKEQGWFSQLFGLV